MFVYAYVFVIRICICTQRGELLAESLGGGALKSYRPRPCKPEQRIEKLVELVKFKKLVQAS